MLPLQQLLLPLSCCFRQWQVLLIFLLELLFDFHQGNDGFLIDELLGVLLSGGRCSSHVLAMVHLQIPTTTSLDEVKGLLFLDEGRFTLLAFTRHRTFHTFPIHVMDILLAHVSSPARKLNTMRPVNVISYGSLITYCVISLF